MLDAYPTTLLYSLWAHPCLSKFAKGIETAEREAVVTGFTGKSSDDIRFHPLDSVNVYKGLVLDSTRSSDYNLLLFNCY
jgi:hypothetical protein